MKRRSFLKNSALASSLFMVPSFVSAMDDTLFTTLGRKRLVLIQLHGGNDGLNTVIPYRNDIYYKSRPTLAIKKSNVLKLNDELGLHKNLKPLRKLFNAGELSIINNVGYPNPNRSHFRSSDIWQTGSASQEVLHSGWIGRYLDTFGNKPYDAIEIGKSLSLLMKGDTNNAVVTKSAKDLHAIADDPFFNKIVTSYRDPHLSEHNMGYLYQTLIDGKQSANYIYEKSKTKTSYRDYGKSAFGKQLKTMAEFINSGIDTKVYYASMGGFDTHASQSGRQDKLLKTYAQAVSAMVEDLKANDTFKDTIILTFSEFGRRVAENAGLGTDHGAANNVFVIGSKLKKPGLFNSAPSLTNLDLNGDIPYEVDFRSIYANILNNWLEVSNEKILSESVAPIHVI